MKALQKELNKGFDMKRRDQNSTYESSCFLQQSDAQAANPPNELIAQMKMPSISLFVF